MTIHSIPAPALRGAAAALALALAACSDLAPGPTAAAQDLAPRMLVNGVDDFEHTAAAAIMVYDPAFPGKPGWRSFCSAALVHERVVQTAGHCIQFLGAQLAAGIVKAAWVSFQHDPLAHFDADPALEDPAAAGWYEIESMHDNPDNIDFLELITKTPDEVRAVWGKFHDSGAIVLKESVSGIRPMKMVRGPGVVDHLLRAAGCRADDSEVVVRGRSGMSCDLLMIAYGLEEFPPVTLPPVQVRRSAPMRYKGIDPLFISTFDGPPGSDFGANCPGDSGAPFVLLEPNGKDRVIVAISSSPADPFPANPCASGGLQYRVDTPSHIRFINGVIESVR